MSETSLKQRLQDDMKAALKSGDKPRLNAIRLINAAIKQREVDERISLNDADVLAVLDKAAKQRRESIAQYQAANRQDLVDQEEFELTVIQNYLPEPLSKEALDNLVKAAITEAKATSIKEMGQVMAILRPQVQGRVDMSVLSATVKDILSQ
ncbi:MAG: GatB/YqeY domain-containing protein [Gammaproteobacteria bacterium]|jgi:uncharacterized protein YqeY